MAEIKIEKKKPVWPWIIVALIVLGAIAYFVFYEEYEDEEIYENEEIDDTTIDGSYNDTIPGNSSLMDKTGEYVSYLV